MKQGVFWWLLLSFVSRSTGSVPGIKLRAASVQIDNQALPETRAVEGGQALLPCNLTRPASEDTVSLVLWYKGDGGAPMYSVDLRHAPNSSKHFSSKAFGPRARFEFAARGPAVLRVEPVNAEDAGEYRCRVDYRWARTQTSVVFLRVVVTPREVRIYDSASGRRVTRTAGPYDEDSNVRVYCEADRGDPPPRVTWWRGNELLDASMEDGPKARNELTLTKVSRKDLGANLTCHASNSNLSEAARASIILDLNLRPLTVSIVSPPRPLSAGRGARLQCESSGSRPAARISWWKDGAPVAENVTSRSGNGSSTLHLWPTRRDHGSTLSCHADNPVMTGSLIKDSWILDIYYKPEVTVSLEPANASQPREGTDVFLRCHARANPAPETVTWQRDGRAMASSDPRIHAAGDSLTLRHVSRSQAGRYRCTAANVEGAGISEELHLTVLHAPTCQEESRAVFAVPRGGGLVEVACSVLAEPPVVSYEWFVNGTRVRNTEARLGVSEPGQVSCQARNSIGAQTEPCVFAVLFADPPEALTECHTTNHTVHCRALVPAVGPLAPSYHLEAYRGGHLITNQSNSRKPEFDLRGLQGSRLVLYASGLGGQGPSLSLQLDPAPFSPPAENRRTPQNDIDLGESPLVSPLLGAVIGVVLVFVILAIGMVLRRSRQNHREISGPSTPIEGPAKGGSPYDLGDLNGGPIPPPHGLPESLLRPPHPSYLTAPDQVFDVPAIYPVPSEQAQVWSREPPVILGRRTTLM